MAVSETMFLNAESYWSQLDDASDERLQVVLEFLAYYLTTPGGRAFWSHPQSGNLSPSFRRVVERQTFVGDRLDSQVRRGAMRGHVEGEDESAE